MARIKWRLKGFEELRRAPGVRADLKTRAERIAAAAGEGYEPFVTEGKSRSRGAVVTTTNAAKRDSARNNSLIRSLDAGR